MENSPALQVLLKRINKIDSIDDHLEDIKTERIDNVPSEYEWCNKHHVHKHGGICGRCEVAKNFEVEKKRREEATVSGKEKWIGNTCFKKDRQTKKYVSKMMKLTGKQYRTLMRKARRNEKNK